jgi:uncharacterized protein (DUF1501 family)
MTSSEEFLFSRRLFLSRGVALLSAAATLPAFLDHSARCLAADFAANPQGAGRNDHVLVVVQMAGGNDGLNTVVPVRNDDYYRARPRIGIAKKDALKINDDFGFHPSATGFKKLFDAGNLAILQCVGYPNPNRSHFRGTDIWASAEPEKAAASGWLGRYFDSCCSGSDPGPGGPVNVIIAGHGGNGAGNVAGNGTGNTAGNGIGKGKLPAGPADPSAAVSLTSEPPLALQGAKYLPIVFHSPDALTYSEGRRDSRVETAFEKLNDMDHSPVDKGMIDPDHMEPEDRRRMEQMNAAKAPVPHMPLGTNGSVAATQPSVADEFLQRSALNARVYADTIKKSIASVQNKSAYPNSKFAGDLKLVAQMIAAGLPTRVYYVQIGGFDTHGDQPRRHEKLMDELSNGLASFVDDLKALGHLDRTTVMTFSEFGRRVAENGSQGTDHGEAAPLFIMGSSIKPGFLGTAPDLSPAKLHRGDVAFSTDFRSLYATVLRQWLKADDVKVLGNRFAPLELYKKA